MRATAETASLRFRPVRADDAAALFAFQNSDSYWRHFPYNDLSRDVLVKRIGLSLEKAGARRTFFFWVAELEPSGGIVGEATLAAVAPRVATIGWGVAGRHWRKGLGTQTARMLLDYGFHSLNLHRIQAQASVDNIGSIRIMERVGMTREGVRRECVHARGRWWSMAEYAILGRDHIGAAVSATSIKR